MNNPILLGVTGGIGSGKSTICKVFDVLGAKTYYADDRAKFLMETNALLIDEMTHLFGEKAYTNNTLNRKYIADQIFNNKEALEKLNRIVHPAVEKDFYQWVDSNQKEKLLLKEAALLFETGAYKMLDYTLLVTANENLRIKRVLKRDRYRNKKSIRAIMSHQLPDKEKKN